MVEKIVIIFGLIGFVAQALEQETAPVVLEVVASNGNKVSFGTDEISRVKVSHEKHFNQVTFQIDGIARKAFIKLTIENIGKQITIEICGEQVAKPAIRDAIFGRGMMVSGFIQDEAKEIGDVLSGRISCR